MDVRDTPITDSDIQCFNVTTTLREILMDCPVGLRIDSDASTVEMSDDDDSESFEPEPKATGSATNKNQKHRSSAIPTDSESESESEEDSDCSSDSEDGNSDGEDGAAKTSGNNEEANAPQAQCIQVILQNGRMINVNAERSCEKENSIRSPNALRCVIGIINGRGWFCSQTKWLDSIHTMKNICTLFLDSGDQFLASHRIVTAQRHQRPPSNQSDESSGQSSKASTDSTSSVDPSKKTPKKSEPNKSNSTDNGNASNTADSSTRPGPSGLQTNQNDSTKASKSNSPKANEHANDEAGPSTRNAGNASNAANAPNVEHRHGLIIVQHRHHDGNDESGNINRLVGSSIN